MTHLASVFDALAGIAVLWLAWRALASPQLLTAIIMFVAFGLIMALVWVRLDAPDIALAEVAIGAGLTGALLFAAFAKLPGAATTHGEDVQPGDRNPAARVLRHVTVFLLSMLAAGLVIAGLALPPIFDGLSVEVAANLDQSGVSNPVTAVLLNFRAYDTLLEMCILLVALLGVWSLSDKQAQRDAPAGLVLDALARFLTPLLILVAAYVLWTGAFAPGGAFQAGAVLGAAAVLLLLTGWRPGPRFSQLPLKLILVTGLVLFLAIALATAVTTGQLLEFAPNRAGTLILLLEIAATLSIGATLAALFLGKAPSDKDSK